LFFLGLGCFVASLNAQTEAADLSQTPTAVQTEGSTDDLFDLPDFMRESLIQGDLDDDAISVAPHDGETFTNQM